MVRAYRSASIRAIANQKAEDYMWGIPESPEFSSVQRLMNEFQAHASQEEHWLSSYKQIAEEPKDPMTRFLLGLIVADEEKHHELMRRMISRLKDELAWTRSERAARTVRDTGHKRKGLLAMVEQFLDLERSGIKEYEKLYKASQGSYHAFFALLYKTMMLDSLKHIAILEFLRRRLRGNRRADQKRKQ